jgi:hypothetical protein
VHGWAAARRGGRPAGGAGAGAGATLQQQQGLELMLLLRNYEVNTPLGHLPAFNEERYITGAIKRRTTWQQLRQLLHDYGGSFNHIHASALLTHAAQLHDGPKRGAPGPGQPGRLASAQAAAAVAAAAAGFRPGEQGYLAFLHEALQLVEQQLPGFQQRQLANCLWAVSKLQQQRLRPELTQALVDGSSLRLADMNPTQLSITIWALANMQHSPDRAWVERFLGAAREQLPSFTLQELASTAWGLATLQVRPGERWMQALLGCAEGEARRLRSLQLQEQEQRWQQRDGPPGAAPPAAAVPPPLQRTFSSFYHSSVPLSVANLAWGCARLGAQPSAQLLGDLLRLFSGRMHEASRTELSMLLWSLASLRLRPGLHWMELALRHALGMAPSFDARSATLLVYCCARLATDGRARATVGAGAEGEADERGGELGGGERQQLQQLVYSWLPAFLAATQQLVPTLNPQDLANTFWALALLQCVPPAAWLQQALPAVAKGLASSTAQGCANLVWAMGRLELVLPGATAAAVLQQTLKQLPFFNTGELVMVLWGVGRLRVQVPSGSRQPPARPQSSSSSRSSSSGSRSGGGSSSSVDSIRRRLSPTQQQALAGSNRIGSHAAPALAHPSTIPSSTSSTASSATSSSAISSELLPSFSSRRPPAPPPSRACTAPAASAEAPDAPAARAPPRPASPPPPPPPAVAAVAAAAAAHTPAPAAAAAPAQPRAQRLRPPDYWVEQLTEQVYELMPRAFSTRDVSAILAALARLQHRPSEPWLHSLMAEAMPHLHTMQPREACSVLAAHATLHMAPQPRFLDWLWALGPGEVARWRPPELAMLLWSVGRLQLPASRPWLLLLLAGATRQMDCFSPRELAAMVYGLCKVGLQRELHGWHGGGEAEARTLDAWLAALQASSAPRLHAFRQHELANMLWSLARLRVALQPAWLQRYLDVLQQQAPGFTCPAASVQVLGALEELGASPGRAWLQAFMAAVAPSLDAAEEWELQKLLASLNSIDLVLGLQWTGRLQAGRRQAEEQ